MLIGRHATERRHGAVRVSEKHFNAYRLAGRRIGVDTSEASIVRKDSGDKPSEGMSINKAASQNTKLMMDDDGTAKTSKRAREKARAAYGDNLQNASAIGNIIMDDARGDRDRMTERDSTSYSTN